MYISIVIKEFILFKIVKVFLYKIIIKWGKVLFEEKYKFLLKVILR